MSNMPKTKDIMTENGTYPVCALQVEHFAAPSNGTRRFTTILRESMFIFANS